MVSLPPSARYVIIGAGIHGLSTAMHLAGRLRANGMTVSAGSNRIVVLDKTGIGAGASGIACGVVRNNYYQPAMRELMAHSGSGSAIPRRTATTRSATCKSVPR